jgi:predicted O-methyltransferase YrrM
MDKNTLVKNIIQNIKNGIFVEIGTHEGIFAEYILNNSTNSILYCIDPYISYNDYNDAINETTGDILYEKVSNRLKQKFGDRIIFIRNFSKDAVNYIPEKIDFLYIDGNHEYKYVYKDLELYYSKVKKNCYIIGDDAVDTDNNSRDKSGNVYIKWCESSYGSYGVIKAFEDFCLNKNFRGNIIGTQYLIQM